MLGLTIWLTGLSGSGKTTLSRLLADVLRARGHSILLLDGDQLRSGLSSDLGFELADRAENLRRAAEVAVLFNRAGGICIVACITPLAAHRESIRAIHDGERLVEVFVDVPLDVCEARDAKGLYAKARRGDILDLTGVGSPFEAPVGADVHLGLDGVGVDRGLALLVDGLVGWVG